MDELGIVAGRAIVKRVFYDIMDLIPEPQEDRSDWFKRADGAIQLSNEMVCGFELLRGAELAIVEDTWEEIPLAIRAEQGYTFRNYAQKRCPSLQWSTIENHIRAGRTFILDGKKPSNKVEVILRNPDRTPVIQNGEVQRQMVEFDALQVPISKLVMIRSAVEKGTIDENPVLWSKVADPGISLQEVRYELFSDASKAAKISPEITFELLGPVLIAKFGLDEAVIIDDDGFKWEPFYNPEHKDHDIVKLAMERIFTMLSIKPDEEVINAIITRRNVTKQQREERRIK